MQAKENTKQLELFSQVGRAGSKEVRLKKPLWISHLLHYEKAIFIFITFLTIFIFGFSLGVEKGKKINRLFDINRNQTLNERAAAPSTVKTPAQPIPSKTVPSFTQDENENKDRKIKSGPTEVPKKYTIQVATFSKQKYAEKELASLKQRGYTTFIVSKGGMILVCVGNFLNRDRAQSSLTELKKKYQDCFIRSL